MAGIVVVHKSMSLDGFVAGPAVSVDDPMGRGGARLHDWLFAPGDVVDPADAEIAAAMFEEVGAVVLGRTTFEVGLPQWEDTPYPVPCFVLTRRPRPVLTAASGTFTFVTSGAEAAVAAALEEARGKSVIVMGAETSRRLLGAGLVDEIQLNLVPLLLGDGARLFGDPASPRLELERIGLTSTARATHLRFRVSPRG